MSSNKVFVGNLSWNTKEEDLRRLFESCGKIKSLKIITDRETNRSRGFAFVEFETIDATNAAIALNGSNVDGRVIKVNEAIEKDRNSNYGRK